MISGGSFIYILLYRFGSPAPGCAAGQDQCVHADGESDFCGIDIAFMPAVDGCVQKIGQNRRLQTRRVGVDQHKERIVGEEPAGAHQEGINAGLDLPDFSLGAAPVGRRIHDDRVVGIATADFALDELGLRSMRFPAPR